MVELPHQAFLFATAEVAAAFVGFSLVVSLFGANSGRDTVRAVSLRDVAEISLVGVAASLAPYVFFQFGWSQEVVWRATSALLAAGWITGFAFAARRIRSAGGGRIFETDPGFARFSALLVVAGIAPLAWNVAVPGAHSSARYMLALLILLSLAGIIFVFAAFHRRDRES